MTLPGTEKMTDEEVADLKQRLTEDNCYSIGWGLIFCVWCCPKTWDKERIETEINAKGLPTGGITQLRWHIAEPRERDDEYSNLNQLPCPQDPENRIHWLINC